MYKLLFAGKNAKFAFVRDVLLKEDNVRQQCTEEFCWIDSLHWRLHWGAFLHGTVQCTLYTSQVVNLVTARV